MEMGNLSDLVQGITKGNKTGIEMAGAVVGTLSDVVGYVKVGVEVVNYLLSKDDELQQVLASIQKDFDQLTSFIAAEDKLARMRDIDAGINPALAVFQQLPAILDRLPSLSQDFILSQIQTCLGAALFFAEHDDKWQAVWRSIPYYSDEWSGQLAPDASGDGLVFNYTYTLPQFLRAIYILLTTIGALAPTSLANYQATLGSCLSRLSAVHDTIVSSGIVGTRVPNSSFEVGRANFPVEEPFDGGMTPALWWETSWVASGLFWPYGAVERYSGASLVVSYPDCYGIDLRPRDTADNFIRLIQLRIAQQKKALYIQLGLPEVRQVINHLRSMTGQPPLAEARYEDSSLKEALGIMGLPPSASVRSLRSVFEATPPFGGWWQVTTDPDTARPPIDPATGFYTETWVPGQPLPAGLRGLLAGY
jgi:hypothetical protein